jgi:hypothetical protein
MGESSRKSMRHTHQGAAPDLPFHQGRINLLAHFIGTFQAQPVTSRSRCHFDLATVQRVLLSDRVHLAGFGSTSLFGLIYMPAP